jgi:hypothetical protein
MFRIYFDQVNQVFFDVESDSESEAITKAWKLWVDYAVPDIEIERLDEVRQVGGESHSPSLNAGTKIPVENPARPALMEDEIKHEE